MLLNKSACFVLASLPGTVKRETRVSRGAAALFGTRRVSARRGWAGEKSGLLKQPAGYGDDEDSFPFVGASVGGENAAGDCF